MGNRVVMRAALIAGMAVVSLSMHAEASGPNTYPGGALAPNGASGMISGNSSLWYNFDYAGDRTKIQITLQNGFLNNLAFNLYTPDEISLPSDFSDTPIGKGTPQTYNCDSGKCTSNDLLWAGDFFISGTFYIRVWNPNSDDKPFALSITGTGVTTHALPPPIPVPYTGTQTTNPAPAYTYPTQPTYPQTGYYPGQYPTYPQTGYYPGQYPTYPQTGYYPGQYPYNPPAPYVPSGATGCFYWVRYGDTLWSIATRYRTDVWQLARVNGLVNPSFIWSGQRLFIPYCR